MVRLSFDMKGVIGGVKNGGFRVGSGSYRPSLILWPKKSLSSGMA